MRRLFRISLWIVTAWSACPALALAHDPDLDAVLDAVHATPCSEVQVLIAREVAVIRWSRQSLRYLYPDDFSALRSAARGSGKRVTRIPVRLGMPELSDPDWSSKYERFVRRVNWILDRDYDTHPPDGC